MGDLLISAAIQVIAVLAIAWLVWLIWGRKKSTLRAYVGLTVTPWSAALLGALVGAAGLAALLNIPSVRSLAGGENSVIRSVDGLNDGAALLAIFILAVFKTAFAEELLFRGVIGKRLIDSLGFGTGNTIQAALFGAVHLVVLLSPDATVQAAAAIVAYTAVSAWVSGLINETIGRGSILPGWAGHAAANLGSYLLVWSGR